MERYQWTSEERQARAERKSFQRMTEVDGYPADIRVLVHEYGLTVVKTLRQLGITKARQIKHVVETVLDEFSPTRGSYSAQGIRTEVDRPSPTEEETGK